MMIPPEWKPIASLTLQKGQLLYSPLRIKSPSRTLLFRELLSEARSAYSTRSSSASSSRAGSNGGAGRYLRDSYIQVHLPLKDNHSLYTDYANIYGGVRVGKLLEDLDALAAAVAFLHLPPVASGLNASGEADASMDTSAQAPEKIATIVTAAVDHIDVDDREQLITGSVANLRLSGLLTHVGNTSMEVR